MRGGHVPKVIILLGPTGVGKTETAIRMARRLATEIIGVDSMQVYRGMDIGTAKPTPEQLGAVRHHMIDIVAPSSPFSAGKYLEAVVPVIEELHGRGMTPLMVGGTGLYIRALTRGLFPAPGADPDIRAALLSLEKDDPGTLYGRLQEVDPVAASRIPPGDVRRIVRALEVHRRAGVPISEMQRERTVPSPYAFVKVGLTRDRTELYAMIEDRVDRMFRDGFVEEVQRVLAMNPCYTARQAIGYREVISYLEGAIDAGEMRRLVKRNSKRYAKRQYTWFRKEDGVAWVDITGIFEAGTIADLVLKRIEDPKSDD